MPSALRVADEVSPSFGEARVDNEDLARETRRFFAPLGASKSPVEPSKLVGGVDWREDAPSLLLDAAVMATARGGVGLSRGTTVMCERMLSSESDEPPRVIVAVEGGCFKECRPALEEVSRLGGASRMWLQLHGVVGSVVESWLR